MFNIGRRKCWVSITHKGCRAEAPSCNWSGLVWTLAYSLNPALARSLFLVVHTENSWLTAALKKKKGMQPELNGLTTTIFE